MNRPISALSFILVLLVVGSPCFGQVREGLHEANISGGLSFINANGNTSALLQLDMSQGYFVNDRFEVGGNLSITKAENVDAFGDLGGFASIHFPSSGNERIVPYIGGQLGFGYGRNDDPFVFGGYAGVKLFVTDGGGAYTVQAYYTRQNFDNSGINDFGIMNGISIFY